LTAKKFGSVLTLFLWRQSQIYCANFRLEGAASEVLNKYGLDNEVHVIDSGGQYKCGAYIKSVGANADSRRMVLASTTLNV
jgi:hypothetical protein